MYDASNRFKLPIALAQKKKKKPRKHKMLWHTSALFYFEKHPIYVSPSGFSEKKLLKNDVCIWKIIVVNYPLHVTRNQSKTLNSWTLKISPERFPAIMDTPKTRVSKQRNARLIALITALRLWKTKEPNMKKHAFYRAGWSVGFFLKLAALGPPREIRSTFSGGPAHNNNNNSDQNKLAYTFYNARWTVFYIFGPG